MKILSSIFAICLVFFYTSCSVHKGKTPPILQVSEFPQKQDSIIIFAPLVKLFSSKIPINKLERSLREVTESIEAELFEKAHEPAMQDILSDFNTSKAQLTDSIGLWFMDKLDSLLRNKELITKSNPNILHANTKNTYLLFTMAQISNYKTYSNVNNSLLFYSTYTRKRRSIHVFLLLIKKNSHEIILYRNSAFDDDASLFTVPNIKKQLMGSISKGFWVAKMKKQKKADKKE